MPGAPHFGSDQPISQRSTAEVVSLFIVLPVIAGITLFSFTIGNLLIHRETSTLSDWCWQLGVGGFLSFGLVAAIPAAGYQELRRRRNIASQNQTPNKSADNT